MISVNCKRWYYCCARVWVPVLTYLLFYLLILNVKNPVGLWGAQISLLSKVDRNGFVTTVCALLCFPSSALLSKHGFGLLCILAHLWHIHTHIPYIR